MSRIFVIIVTVVAVAAARKQHPKFPRMPEDYESYHEIRKVACSSDNENQRIDIMAKAKCGAPKEVFVTLKAQAAHERINPGAVWVKRCVGLCDDTTSCVPLKKETRRIPIRIENSKTRKETCATYEVEEHLACGCCAGAPESCAPPRVYDPRKCGCRCPNRQERRQCRNKRNQIMRWNPFKCACEEVRRVR